MKNMSKKIVATVIMLIIGLANLTVVNAANTTVTLIGSSKLVAEKTITIDIKVNNPVYGMSATLYYDPDVFEGATISSEVANSSSLSNNVIVIESGNIMPAGTIATITLRVKSNISKTEGNVSLSEIKITNEEISTQTLTDTSITIKADDTNDNTDDKQTTNTQTDNTTNNDKTNDEANKSISNSTTNEASNTADDPTKIDGVLPNTGIKTNVIITTLLLLIIAVVVALGIIIWIRYKKQ